MYRTHPGEAGELHTQLAEIGCTGAAEAGNLRTLPAPTASYCTGAAEVEPYTVSGC